LKFRAVFGGRYGNVVACTSGAQWVSTALFKAAPYPLGSTFAVTLHAGGTAVGGFTVRVIP
jgi:hypothetical protein